MRKDEYDRLLATISKTGLNIATGVHAHTLTGDIKLSYQHLDGKMSNLPNVKRQTIKDVLLSRYVSRLASDVKRKPERGPPSTTTVAEGTTTTTVQTIRHSTAELPP